ncbi:cardiolipin synthase [Clostridium aminobutyricum]|uniref:Cardiolipin synthase n=1 Tax=Clostridium aminobutyricum TaxID=33953 RepID=A0A939D6G2_CLOAM|nr:cardiolipin synthase [Clostridium aminobutyricum]MBN7771935.1 cardiolipin synthase [Clostridium aminobutyricum]
MHLVYDIFNRVPYFVTILFVTNLFIAFTIIFLERKNPSATLAWIMILFLIPIVGIFFYFLFSQNLSRKKIFKMTRFEEETIHTALHEQIKEMKTGEYSFTTFAARNWSDMIRLHQVYSNAFFTEDNSVSIFTDGHEFFDSLIRDIEAAECTINIQYFIIKNDLVGRKILDVLTDKAKSGIEVRLLIDAMGSRQLSYSTLSIKKLLEAGGKVAFFFPPKFKYLNLKLNYRNHRKMVVIDGRIGYIGGFNIGKEYLGLKKKFGYWRDTHLRILGSSVQDINARFLMDWRFASKEEIVLSEAYYSKVIQEGCTGIQIVSCGPDEQKAQIKRGYMKMITSAHKNIYIQTPYFVPDSSILESLKMAAQSGVDVRVMIPCMPDHMFVYWATYSYVGELIRSGARVFIYDNGFMHAKTIVVDGEVASVGSANFDMRSFKLNFESNAFIFDEKLARKLETIFEQDISNSHELTKEIYNSRGMMIQFKESVSRLLSDLL